MAVDYNPTLLGSGFGSVDDLNANFEAIETALADALSRSGAVPNAMTSPLDMNSNRILNLGDGVQSADAVTFSQLNAFASAFTTGEYTTVSNIAGLTALDTDANSFVYVAGYNTINDGGGGLFYWDSGNSDTADNGLLFESDAGGAGRWTRLIFDHVTPKMFGAVADATTDDTATFDAALATGRKVIVTEGDYSIANIGMVSNMDIEGEKKGHTTNVTLFVRTNDAAAFNANGSVGNIRIGNMRIRAANGVTGARGIRQQDKGEYMSYVEFYGLETWANLEITYDVWVIFCSWDRCRDGFSGTSPGGQTHKAIECIPAAYGQTEQLNLNQINKCQFFRSTANAAVDMRYGNQLTIRDTDFENCDCQALYVGGIFGLYVQNCWFEDCVDTEIIQLNLTPSPNPQGTRPAIVENCYVLMNATNTRFITVGGASNVSVNNNVFLQVPVAAEMVNPESGLREFFGNTLLSGGTVSTFFPRSGSIVGALDFNIDNQVKPFVHTITGLSDNPGSPELVATFTIPPGVIGIQGQMGVIDMEAMVTHVDGNSQLQAANRQKLEIIWARNKDASTTTATIQASLATSGSTSFLDGAGWTSAPVWSINVSGQTIQLLMTSNPSGGAFSGGRAYLSGTMINGDTSTVPGLITVA